MYISLNAIASAPSTISSSWDGGLSTRQSTHGQEDIKRQKLTHSALWSKETTCENDQKTTVEASFSLIELVPFYKITIVLYNQIRST